MALAILRFVDAADGHASFDVSIGSNLYYVYAVGDGVTERLHGIEFLSEPIFTSEMVGPVAPSANGRTQLDVPLERFDREHRQIQLMSFRTPQRDGPAVSDVLRVPTITGWGNGAVSRLGRPVEASAQSLAFGASRRYAAAPMRTLARSTVPSRTSVPFRLVEAASRPELSTQMVAWDALIGLLPRMLKEGGPIASNLLTGLFGRDGVPGPIPELIQQVAVLLQSEEGQRLVVDIVQAALAEPGSVRTQSLSARVIAPHPRIGQSRALTTLGSHRRTDVSEAMFAWIPLVAALAPQIVQIAGPILGSLLGGLFGGRSGEGGPGGALGGVVQQITGLLGSEKGQNAITTIVRGVANEAAGTPTPPPAATGTGTPPPPARTPPAATVPPPTTPPPATIPPPAAADQVSRQGSLAIGASRRARMPRRPSRTGQRSQAMFLDGGALSGPMLTGLLGAALPALLPMLGRMAGPSMLGGMFGGGSPEQTLGAITDIMMDPNQRQFERLWAHTPQVGPSALAALLAQMSISADNPVPSFRETTRAALSFGDLPMHTVYGTPRILVRAGRDLVVPLVLQAPKPVTGAELHWQVKDLRSQKTLAHDLVKLGRIESGALAPLAIPASALGALPVSEDYILRVSLIWSAAKGGRIGVRHSTTITLVGGYVFDRVEAAATAGVAEPAPEPIPLNDTQAHREVWHKIWAGGFGENARRRRFECKYYYALGERGVQRLETRHKRERDADGKPVTRLRTGLMLGLDVLNRLGTQLTSEPALDADRLTALRGADFRARFAQAALARLTLRGRAADRAALWVYPEVRMERLVLQRIVTVNADGIVTELAEDVARFPMPVLAHFIGTQVAR